MVDLDLDQPGSYRVIGPRLSEMTGRPVNQKSLSMALTGFRNGPASRALLEDLLRLLSAWPLEAA